MRERSSCKIVLQDMKDNIYCLTMRQCLWLLSLVYIEHVWHTLNAQLQDLVIKYCFVIEIY